MPWKPIEDPPAAEVRNMVREHQGKAKFLVDENLGGEVTQLLRDVGWNATDVFELNIAGHPDENVFAAARRQDRILLTHDDDFLDDRRFPPRLNPGLVVLPGADGNVDALISAIHQLLGMIGNLRELWRATKVVIATDGTWKIMRFEQSEGRVIKNRFRFLRDRMEVWEDET